MKALMCTAYGGPEVLKIQEVAKPEPKPGEVRIKVFAAAVTTADTMMRQGTPRFARLMLGLRKPKNAIVGTGFSGQVDALGEGVTEFQLGDQVFGESGLGFGANAEYVCVSANGVMLRRPEQLSHAEAAVFFDGVVTSWNFLNKQIQLRPGQQVLINGASGSLGTAAVQLAKYLGAEVTAVCSGRNRELVQSLGADHVIDYTQHDFARGEQRYDVIYDTVGKRSFTEVKGVLKEDGVYLSPVMTLPLLWQMWRSKNQRQRAIFSATGLLPAEKLRGFLQELLEPLQTGALKLVVEKCYPLQEGVEAHHHVDSGRKRGNVVLAMPVLQAAEAIASEQAASGSILG